MPDRSWGGLRNTIAATMNENCGFLRLLRRFAAMK
jgi:hypothetical protein